MGIFHYDKDGRFGFYVEPGEKVWLKEAALKRASEIDNDDPKQAWVANALDVYSKLCEYFCNWKGVRIMLTSSEFPIQMFCIAVDCVRAVDLYFGNVLEQCIMRSDVFNIGDSAALGFMALNFSFFSDEDDIDLDHAPYDDEDDEEKDVDPHEAFEIKEYLMESVAIAIGELEEQVDEFIKSIDIGDVRLDPDKMYELARSAVTSYKRNNDLKESTCSLFDLVHTICRLLSGITRCSSACHPEMSVVCNDGSLRLNAKVCDLEMDGIKKWLPPLLRAASNIHIVHTDGRPRDPDPYDVVEDDSYLAFDISIDIPILS